MSRKNQTRRGRWCICRITSGTLLLESQLWVGMGGAFSRRGLQKPMTKALVVLNFILRVKRDLPENFKQGRDPSWSAFAKDNSDSWVKDAARGARVGLARTAGKQSEKSKGKIKGLK